MRIGCLGMATLDTLLFTGEPVYDHEAVTPVDEAVVSVGGKGIVSAIAMQRAGGEVVPFATVGKDAALAQQIPAALDDRFLLPHLEQDSRTWITVSEAHKVVTFVAQGAPDEAADGLTGEIDEFVSEIDALYLTIEAVEIVRAALHAAARRDLPVAFNPSLPMLELLRNDDPALLPEIVSQSRFILCNDWEAELFLRRLGAHAWADLDAPRLMDTVVTAGEDGGTFFDPGSGGWERYSAAPVEDVRCVVGAGDTFNGAFLIARLAHGLSAGESCERAAVLAAEKVRHRTSALPLWV